MDSAWPIVIASLGSALLTGVATNVGVLQFRPRRREARREAYSEFLAAVITMTWLVEEAERSDNVKFIGGSAKDNEIALAEIVWKRLDDSHAEWDLERRRAHLALARVQMEGPDKVYAAGERLLNDLKHQRSERFRLPAHLRDPRERDTTPDPAANRDATERTREEFLKASRRVLKTEGAG